MYISTELYTQTEFRNRAKVIINILALKGDTNRVEEHKKGHCPYFSSNYSEERRSTQTKLRSRTKNMFITLAVSKEQNIHRN